MWDVGCQVQDAASQVTLRKLLQRAMGTPWYIGDFAVAPGTRKGLLLIKSESEGCSVVSDSLRPHGLYS